VKSLPSSGEDERSPIIVEDEALRDGFTQIPNAIVRHPGITPGAKVAYAVLLSYAWKDDRCFPGQERMSMDMAVSKPSVIAYLKQLQQAGLITITRRGQGKSNIYSLPALRSKDSLLQEIKKTAPLEVKNFDPTNTQRKDSKKKMQISNFELSPPIEIVQTATSEFKTTHPDLWQAGCSGVAEFIKTVGRGLWTDEAMNVSQWQAHADAKRLARK
jgi:DNA-binding transcriptional ArsR family regulator